MRPLAALLLVPLLWLSGGCADGGLISIHNQSSTVVNLRVEALAARTLEVKKSDDVEDRRHNQPRFGDNPASGLRGISPDRRTFGPVRLNPGETVTLRVIPPTREELANPELQRRVKTLPALQLAAVPILAQAGETVRQEIYEPVPLVIALTGTVAGLRFEVPLASTPRPGDTGLLNEDRPPPPPTTENLR